MNQKLYDGNRIYPKSNILGDRNEEQDNNGNNNQQFNNDQQQLLSSTSKQLQRKQTSKSIQQQSIWFQNNSMQNDEEGNNNIEGNDELSARQNRLNGKKKSKIDNFMMIKRKLKLLNKETKNKKMNKMYLEDLLEKKRKESFIQIVETQLAYGIKYFFLPFVLFSANFLCVFNMVVLNYVDIGTLDQRNMDWVNQIELFVGVVFIIESFYYLIVIPGPYFEKLTDSARIVELINVFEIFWNYTGSQKNFVVIFLRSTRAFRIKKLRRQFQLAKYFFRKFMATQNQSDFYYEAYQQMDDDSLGTFLIDSIIDFIGGIFFQSALILALDEVLDYDGFYYPHKLDYVATSYFVIVSFSTIGYGEIYPTTVGSRMFMTLLLVINITIMSNFLSNLIEQIYNQSPYVTTYDFHNHVIIAGCIPPSYLIRFMNELIEYDIIQRTAFLTSGIKVIIIGPDEPSHELRHMILYYAENPLYDNEVVYLKADIFSDNITWFRQASLSNCKTFFAFSQTIDGDPHQTDLELTFVSKFIKMNAPLIDVYLVLSTSFKSQIQNDSLFSDITIISSTEFNETVMANSIENVGFSTFLQHLLSIRQKQVPDDLLEMLGGDTFQQNYIKDMQQEMYCVKFNDFFIGKTFQEAAKIFYYSGFELNELQYGDPNEKSKQDRLATLIGIETKEERSIKVEEEDNAFVSQQSLHESDFRKKVLINPIDYVIQDGDLAYLICDDQSEVILCQNLNENTKQYRQAVHNELKLQSFQLDDNNHPMLKNWWNQNFEQKLKAERDSIKRNKKSKTKTFIMKASSLKTNYKTLKRFYDFTLMDYPCDRFQSHIIIFGSLASFSRMIELLRLQSNRAIILYTEENFDQFKWATLADEHKNIYYLKGEYHNVHHINFLNIEECYQILILSTLQDDLFQDSDSLCLARLIMEYFNQSRFLVELKDDSTLSFFTQNPLFKIRKDVNSPFLFPLYQQGSIHLSSCLFGLLSRCVYNGNWLKFANHLLTPISQYSEIQKENRRIKSYHLNEDIVAHCQYFGVLQSLLLNNSPIAIAVALIKFQITSNFKKKLFSSLFLQKRTTQGDINLRSISQQENEISDLAGRLLGNRFILTNPSFFTPLDKTDIVLVLGDLVSLQEVKRKMRMDQDEGALNRRYRQSLTSNQLNFRHSLNLQPIKEEIKEQMEDKLRKITSKIKTKLKDNKELSDQKDQGKHEEEQQPILAKQEVQDRKASIQESVKDQEGFHGLNLRIIKNESLDNSNLEMKSPLSQNYTIPDLEFQVKPNSMGENEERKLSEEKEEQQQIIRRTSSIVHKNASVQESQEQEQERHESQRCKTQSSDQVNTDTNAESSMDELFSMHQKSYLCVD